MKAKEQMRQWPFVTAFVIWFAHFMVSWVASEIWHDERIANAVAWGATAIALLAMALHFSHVRRLHRAGGLADEAYRFARGAACIATTAIVFSALPPLVLLPHAQF